jgi:hypothetical protein
MPKDNLPNLARLIYEAYPDSDLLPIDPRSAIAGAWTTCWNG